MELPEALETYLVDTGQIHPLAKRQARLLSRHMADESLQHEAHVFLLLSLAALNKGAPRASKEFLLEPLHGITIEQYITEYKAEHAGIDPAWKNTIADPVYYSRIAGMLDSIVQSPSL